MPDAIRDVLLRIRTEVDPRTAGVAASAAAKVAEAEKVKETAIRNTTTRIHEQSRATTSTTTTIIRSADATRKAIVGLNQGMTALVRGVALLASSGNDSAVQMLKTLAIVEGVVQTSTGLLTVVKQLTVAYRGYRSAVAGAAAAQAALGAAQAAGGAAAGARVGVGLAGGLGLGVAGSGAAAAGGAAAFPIAGGLALAAGGILAVNANRERFAYPGGAGPQNRLVGGLINGVLGFGSDFAEGLGIPDPLGIYTPIRQERAAQARQQRFETQRAAGLEARDIAAGFREANQAAQEKSIRMQVDAANKRLEAERQILTTMQTEARTAQQMVEATRARLAGVAQNFALLAPGHQQGILRLRGQFLRGEQLTPQQLAAIQPFVGSGEGRRIEDQFTRFAEQAGLFRHGFARDDRFGEGAGRQEILIRDQSERVVRLEEDADALARRLRGVIDAAIREREDKAIEQLIERYGRLIGGNGLTEPQRAELRRAAGPHLGR